MFVFHTAESRVYTPYAIDRTAQTNLCRYARNGVYTVLRRSWRGYADIYAIAVCVPFQGDFASDGYISYAA